MGDYNVRYLRYYLNNETGMVGHKFLMEILRQKYYKYVSRKGFVFTFDMHVVRADFEHFLGFATIIRYIEDQPDVVHEYMRLRSEIGMTIDQALLVCANYKDHGYHSLLNYLSTLKNLSGFSLKKHFFDKKIVGESIEGTIMGNSQFFRNRYIADNCYIRFTPELYKKYLNEPGADRPATGQLSPDGSAYEVLAA